MRKFFRRSGVATPFVVRKCVTCKVDRLEASLSGRGDYPRFEPLPPSRGTGDPSVWARNAPSDQLSWTSRINVECR